MKPNAYDDREAGKSTVVAYHGTVETAVENILKEGFRVGTYFTNQLDSALRMGGPYVFGVVFDEAFPCWEYISNEVVKPDRIAYVQRIEAQNIYYSPDVERLITKAHQVESCPTCKGHGEVGYSEDGHHLLPGGSAWGKSSIELCPQCKGFGDLQHPTFLENERVTKLQIPYAKVPAGVTLCGCHKVC